MTIQNFFMFVALGLASCNSSTPDNPPTPTTTDQQPASAWTIGPIIDGKDYSTGPQHPTPTPAGPSFAIPLNPGSVHYITYHHGPLTGATTFTLHYRIDAAPGVEIKPISNPAQQSILALYFQRAGDNWSGTGKYDGYRWYSSARNMPVTPGDHTITASITDNWGGVETFNNKTNATEFRDAWDNADEIGFCIGGGTGVCHGVFATGKATLTILDFSVE
jgi:hypothetical protein